MEKLKKYLDKHGIDHEPAIFGSDYFYNAPPIKYEGAFVTIDYRNGTKRRIFENYLKRYNYEITHRSRVRYDFTVVYTVVTARDHHAAALYYEYQGKSLAAFEQMQHEEYTRGNYDIEQKTRAIMAEYEKQYLAALAERENQRKTA